MRINLLSEIVVSIDDSLVLGPEPLGGLLHGVPVPPMFKGSGLWFLGGLALTLNSETPLAK